ncbi:glutathione S-transferase family protein [Sphingorhabdus sp.]|jgi:glutathione S-transferase|uniref:glutathione S-transferase family protein n=1 Tax=Sphingorhabdus sp. TaxID=1902408 RepID=UPI00378324A6
MTYTLWGSAHSLYSGKARSYLIKKGLPFRERYPSDPDFASRILPAVGHFVVPVLETDNGKIIQDSGDIIDFLEQRHAEPLLEPQSPVQQWVSLIFDAFGSEYLLPLAMHYRWSYRAEQETFLRAEFGRAMVAGADRSARREAAARTMEFFAGFLPNLGVVPEVVTAMEDSYLALIDALDNHFQHHPYLLGGRPCRGDFGMMAPLFAHLGRDPVPAMLMKTKAPNLFRWTERMNAMPISDGEYPGYGEDYYGQDSVPDTLIAVLKIVFADWTPGLKADADCFNAWAAHKNAGDVVSRSGEPQIHPNVGKVEYPWRGVTMKRGSAPHMLWMFARAQDLAASSAGEAGERLNALIEHVGGQEAMAISLTKRIMRDKNMLLLA